MKLSIIIPCYRVAAYLPACLDSVCMLPPDSVEILCVNDASPDECGQILAGYAARHPHVHVLTHGENRGLSAARNTGLDAAQGEYVLFLDSDDLLCADVTMGLVDQAQQGRLDILQAAYMLFDDGTDQELPAPPMARPTAVITGDACLAMQCAQGVFEPMTVIRLYRRGFLLQNGLRMAEGFLFEDELFTAPAFLRAGRVQVSDVLLYRYRQHGGGIMGGFAASAGWCGHYLRIVERLVALCAGDPLTPGQRALRKRAAAIALSIPKNIVAYRLAGDVRRETLGFVRVHGREIAGFAMSGGSVVLWVQGVLLRVSPSIFMKTYAFLRRLR
ncbi:MAG: glycosyltransferase [Clostridia bacterium]|nr:glycosyltransferase [Clostridia bacterium]